MNLYLITVISQCNLSPLAKYSVVSFKVRFLQNSKKISLNHFLTFSSFILILFSKH